MNYKVISLMVSGMGGQNVMVAIEDSLNAAADDGYSYIFHFQPDVNRIVIIMGKRKETRGRPRKSGEEALEIED